MDGFSPDHLELSYLVVGKGCQDVSFDRKAIESYGRMFLGAIGSNGIVVVRCGEHGCAGLSNAGSKGELLSPFYHPASPKIVGPIGAANAFLGGFAERFQESGDLREGAIYGSVTASVALEQFGLPKLCISGGEELWNDVNVSTRIGKFRKNTRT